MKSVTVAFLAIMLIGIITIMITMMELSTHHISDQAFNGTIFCSVSLIVLGLLGYMISLDFQNKRS